MVPNSPGGGFDVTARTAVKIAESTGITDAVEVFNLSGGGGVLALSRLMHENGNPDLVMMMGLGVIGATVTNKSAASVTDATPIARLIEEQEGDHGAGGFAVPHDRGPDRGMAEPIPTSSWSAADRRSAGRTTSCRWNWPRRSGSNAGQITYNPMTAGGELLPAVLNARRRFRGVGGAGVHPADQVRATAGARGIRQHPGAEPRRAHPDRIGNRRGVRQLARHHRAAGHHDRRARTPLIDTFTRLDRTAEWQAELTRNGWTDALLTGDDFGSFLAEQDRGVAATLHELGL